MDKFHAFDNFMRCRVNQFEFTQPFVHDVMVALRSAGGEFESSVVYAKGTVTVADIIQGVQDVTENASLNNQDVLVFIRGDEGALPQSYRVL